MMHAPLIATKLFVPTVRKDSILRPRLLANLTLCYQCRLVLITAPAGYGKTTLITSWLDQQDKLIAWISLDKDDNNELLFAAYLVEALRTIDDQLCAMAAQIVNSSNPPPIKTIFTYIINELVGLPRDQHVILVLDDYHAIQEPAIHDAMDFLLEHIPPNLHLVISSREVPPLSLSRLRAQNRVIEIDEHDLRFDRAEIEVFLDRTMSIELQADDITILEQKTEGWIAGLQLAALGIQKHDSTLWAREEFSGGARLIADYLIDEVLSQQPDHVQEFLLQTSPLHRFCAPLCNVILGIDNAQDILDYLERANLFIIPLDDRREWYRYHHLFSELLRQRLEQHYADRITGLLGKATTWFADNELREEAVDYALAAGLFDRAAELLAPVAFVLQNTTKRSLLFEWLKLFPLAVLRQHDPLWMNSVLAHVYSGDFNAANHMLHRLWHTDPAASVDGLETTAQRTIRGHEAALRGLITIHTTVDAQQCQVFTKEAQELLPEQQRLTRGIAFGHYGSACLYLGEASEAYTALTQAIQITEPIKAQFDSHVFSGYLGETLAAQGKLTQAIQVFQAAYQNVRSEGFHEGNTFSNIAAGYGKVLYERNELTQAETFILNGVRLAQIAPSIDRLLYSCEILLRFCLGRQPQHDFPGKMALAMQLAHEYDNPPLVVGRIEALRAAFALGQGDLGSAAMWASQFENRDNDRFFRQQRFEWQTLARVLTAENKFAQALTILGRQRELAQTQGRARDHLLLSVLSAKALCLSGETEQALLTLRSVLDLAAREQFIRTFVDEGPVVYNMFNKLSNAASAGEAWVHYLQQVLDVFEHEEQARLGTDAQAFTQTFEASITPREKEILLMLVQGYTYVEIGARLAITKNTVKYHIKNIYGKLGVRNRAEAVLAAQQLHII